ncbi:MAG TPA: hypothetical protein PKU78_06330 [Candidatus Dojkabacteria bacterium]|nr:hypothetical protein [Candidatus Dojkabacteria bacterium]
MEDIKEQVRQIIKDNGGYVSIIDSPGPITLIFTHVRSDKGNKYPRNSDIYWQKMAVEMGTYKVENLHDFGKNTVQGILNESNLYNKIPIFKLYTAERVGDIIYIRMAFLNSFFGDQVEIDMDTAKEIIADPEKFGLQDRYEFIKDLKVIYGLTDKFGD